MSKQKDSAALRSEADEAWAAHQALIMAELRDPALRDNPHWTILRQDAYERFAIAFGLLK